MWLALGRIIGLTSLACRYTKQPIIITKGWKCRNTAVLCQRFIIVQAFNVCSEVILLSFLQNENLSFSESITLADGVSVMISITSIPSYALKRCGCGNQRLPDRKTLKALCSRTNRYRGKWLVVTFVISGLTSISYSGSMSGKYSDVPVHPDVLVLHNHCGAIIQRS